MASDGRSELDRVVRELKDRIGIQWKTLARELKFSTTDIDAIVVRDRDDLKEQIHRFFDDWKMRQGSAASHRVLIEAIREAKLDEILRDIRLALPDVDFGEDVMAPIEETARDAAPAAPVDPEREHIRSKRLQKLSNSCPNDPSSLSQVVPSSPSAVSRSKSSPSGSPATTKPSPAKKDSKRKFEVGDLVKVERPKEPWYGVIKVIGTRQGRPVAGVEMDDEVEGGHSGEFEGIQYFTCPEGRGVILPLHRLQRDDRFGGPPSLKGQPATAKGDDVEKDKNMPAPPSPSDIPRRKSDPLSPNLFKPATSMPFPPSASSKSSGEKESATIFESSDDGSGSVAFLAFECPGDTAGFIIGRDGKNRREVESKTNTTIRVEKKEYDMSANTRVMITGKKEDCQKAMLLIVQNIRRKTALHTTTTAVIEIPSQHYGRVIGGGGSNVRTIQALTATRINVEKPTGIEFLLGGQLKCEITGGSAEQIERAKEMIRLSVQGVDIANIAKFVAQFMKDLEAEGFKFNPTA